MAMDATIIGRVAIKVVPDTSDFRRDAKRDLSAAEKALPAVKIDFEADVRKAVNETKKAINESQRHARRNPIDLHFGINAASHRVTQARIAFLARSRTVTLFPKLDEAAVAKTAAALLALSGARAFGNIFEDIGDTIRDLDKAIPKIAGLSLGVANLSAYLLTATSNTLTFGASLASIAPAALALPGIFGGLAIGIGATVAVLKDFNTVLPGVADRLHNLQDSMSTKFWDQAKEPFRDFINEIFPQFRAGMEDTSTALGGFFANLATSAKGKFDGQLQGMFDDLADSIDVAGQFTDNFLSILTQLGAVGAGFLPRLAKWVGDIATQFDNWLQGKGRNGLENMIDEGIQALKDLGGVINETAEIFAGLARAAEAAGGSTLAIMRKTLEGVSDVVNSRSFQDSLTGVFEAAHEGMTAISNGSGPQFKSFMERLGHTLEEVFPSAGRAAGEALGAIFDALDQPTVQKAAVNLFKNIEQAISSLAPAMPAVAKGLAAITDIIGQVGNSLAKGLAPAFEALGPAVADLAVDLEPLIDTLGNIFVGAVEGAANVLPGLVTVLGDLAAALNILLTPVELLVDALGTIDGATGGAITALATIGALVGGSLWMGALVRTKLVGVGNAILDAGTKAGVAEGAFLRSGLAAQKAASNFSRMRGGLLFAGAALSGLASSAAPADSALQTISSTAAGVFGGAAIGAVGGPWGALIGGAIGGALSLLSQATDGTSESFRNALPAAEAYASSLDQITGAATEATRALINDSLNKGETKKILDEYGISNRTAINAILGHAGARKKLAAVMDQELQQGELWLAQAARMRAEDTTQLERDHGSEGLAAHQAEVDALQESGEAAVDNAKKLQALIDQNIKLAAETRENALAVADLTKIYKGVPKQVLTKIDQKGGIESLKSVSNLVKQYKLTPKQVRTLVTASNLDLTDKQVQRFITRLKEAGRLKVSPEIKPNTKPAEDGLERVRTSAERATKVDGRMTKFSQGVTQSIRVAERAASNGGRQVKQGVEKPIKQAKGDFSNLQQSIRAATQQGAAAARSGGQSIGVNLKNGILAGFSGTASALAAQAANAVRTAIAAANKAGDIHSPSRKTRKTGENLGEGVIVGLRSKTRGIGEAAQAAVQAVVSKFTSKDLDKITESVKNALDAMLEKAKTSAEKVRLKNMFEGVRERFDDMSKRAERWLEDLDKAKEKVTQLKEEMKSFKEATAQSVIETGNPTSLEFPSLNNIIAQMTEARDNALKFQAVIQQLIKQGLNRSTLQQILAAGPEAGLATAQSILNGGISQVNALQAQIEHAAQGVATAAGDHLFGGLIDEAEGDVDKLIKKLNPLAKRLREFAKDLVQAFRHGLEAEFARKGRDNKPQLVAQSLPNSVANATKAATKAVAHKATAQAAAQVAASAMAPTLAIVQEVAADAGKAFAENFTEALQEHLDTAQGLFDQILSQLATEGQRAQLRAEFEGQLKAAQGLVKQYDALNVQLDEAKAKLQSIQDEMQSFKEQTASSIVSFGDPTKVEFATFGNIIAQMEDARDKARAFGDVVKKLIGQGLNQSTLKQILAAGPEAGLATAEAILNGGVAQINQLQAQIESAAGNVADASGQALFGGLVDTAQGEVDKILSQLEPLQKKLENFAVALVDALKNELEKQFGKINSPSTSSGSGGGRSTSRLPSPQTIEDIGFGTQPGDYVMPGWTPPSAIGTQVNYYAAPGTAQLSAEESLFAAMNRGRAA